MKTLRFLTVNFLLFIALLANLQNLRAAEIPHPSFRDSLDLAYQYGKTHQFDKAEALFKKLLDQHPKLYVIHDAYVRVLILKKEFQTAIKILEIAKKDMPEKASEINSRIKNLQEQEIFSKAIESFPDWEKRKVYTNLQMAVETNIPYETLKPLLSELQEMLNSSQNLLNQIFETENASHAKILPIKLFARTEDYISFMRQHYPQMRFYPAGLFDDKKRELIVYFDGYLDKKTIRHEMVHFLISEFLIERPSSWLTEGLAEYISYKLSKKDAESHVKLELAFLNYFYDQGHLESFFDIFKIWKNYESYTGPNIHSRARVYYLIAWLNIAFFLDSQNEPFKKFFRDYLKYEQERRGNDFRSCFAYFQKHLTETQRKELDKAWFDFVLNLNYEKI